MERTVCTYGGLNLNDGVTWFLMPGFDPGKRIKTYTEHRSYSGAIRQYNVSEANLIHMRVPLRIEAADLAGLRAARDALNDLIDAGEQELVHDDIIYYCAHSDRVSFIYDNAATVCFAAFIDFTPVRYP